MTNKFNIKSLFVIDKKEIPFLILSIFLAPVGIMFAVMNFNKNQNRANMCIYGSIIGIIFFILMNTIFKDMFLYY